MTARDPLRLGIIGSSGGSALAAAARLLALAGREIQWHVVTDRACGLEEWARAHAARHVRFDYASADDFSKAADRFFREHGCHRILLFYTRRVSGALIEGKRVQNIHPALLPAFRGLHGVRDAVHAGVRVFGATLHDVDEGLDTGPIIAQVASALPGPPGLEAAEHLSYVHKVWLTLVWMDQMTHGQGPQPQPVTLPGGMLACPGLRDHRLAECYLEWLEADLASQAGFA